jgi:peroxiredoxin Q/BCP
VIKLKKLYGKEYLGIIRSTFVISPAGEILRKWDKVRVTGHAQEVLEFVGTL